jgi:hypothetical protein
MKKILVGLIVLMMTLCFCGCGEKSPSDVVEDALEAMKAEDVVVFNSLCEKEYSYIYVVPYGYSNSYFDFNEDTLVMLNQKFLDFDYVINNEHVTDDNATVSVTFTTYDFGTSLGVFFAVIDLALEDMKSDITEEERDQELEVIVQMFLDDLTEKNFEQTLTFSLAKGEDGWVIDDFLENEYYMNAITGGVYDVQQENITSYYNEMQDEMDDLIDDLELE